MTDKKMVFLFKFIFVYSILGDILAEIMNPTILTGKIQGRYGFFHVTNNELHCNNAVRKNNNTFITPEFRRKICEITDEIHANLWKSIDTKCFIDSGHSVTSINPCYVVCPIGADIEDPTDVCADHEGAPFFYTYLITNMDCGPNHMCNDEGCCVEKPKIDTPTTLTRLAPTTPTTLASTTSITLAPTTPTTLAPITLTTLSPVTVTSEKITLSTIETTTENSTPIWMNPIFEENYQKILIQGQKLLQQLQRIALYKYSRPAFQCHKPGQFGPKHQLYMSPRYFDCQWVTTVYRCPNGHKFDQIAKKCIKQTHIEVSLEQWQSYIKCHHEGIFKSPYDCRYFYYCTPKHELSSGDKFIVHVTKCDKNLVFDDVHKACRYSYETTCHNKPLPHQQNIHFPDI